MNAYEELANAIIVQAATDYKWALKVLQKPEKQKADDLMRAELYKSDCERFFASDWFTALSDCDGGALAAAIKRSVK